MQIDILQASTMIGVLIGIIIRFSVPFARKVKAGELTWSDIDRDYVITAAVAAITAYLTVWGMVGSGAVPAISWILGISGFVAGVGELDLLNELIKVYSTLKKSE